MVLGKRPAGNEVCVTNTVSLRSRVMGNYQARFWRAAASVRESPTLIENGSKNISALGATINSPRGSSTLWCSLQHVVLRATDTKLHSKS